MSATRVAAIVATAVLLVLLGAIVGGASPAPKPR